LYLEKSRGEKTMWRKIGGLALLLALLVGSVSALSLSNPVPASGSVLLGDGTETFSISTDVAGTVGKLWINNGSSWLSYDMNCASGTSCVATPNLVSFVDMGVYAFYFVVDGVNDPAFPGTHSFSIDRVPSAPTGLVCTGLTEDTLALDWNNNPEADIAHYELQRDGVTVVNVTGSAYNDSGLVTGQNYTFRVRSADGIGQVSGWSSSVVCAPQDMTPPADPAVFPPTGSTVVTSNFIVNVNYAENVSLRVMSGSSVIVDLGYCQACVWNLTLPFEGTFNYELSAKDQSVAHNERRTPWAITYDAGVPFNLSGSVVGAPFFRKVTYRMLKDEGNNGGTDFWSLETNLSYYRFHNIRPIMTDITDIVTNTTVVRVNEDVQPVFFCALNPLTLYWTGSGYSYGIDNVITGSLPIDGQCASPDPSGVNTVTGYMSIPIMAGLPYGMDRYRWTIGWDATLV
jgi:hypothetical protein